jgi:hypothetical protein
VRIIISNWDYLCEQPVSLRFDYVADNRRLEDGMQEVKRRTRENIKKADSILLYQP